MLLNKDEIIEQHIVDSSVEGNFRAAGYDISIETMVDVDGNEVSESFVDLRPQAIVWVISRESIQLDNKTLAYATIKTGLCNDGVLALNIGIVDPGWKGPLSTAFVNFGKQTVRLRKGQQFLRLTFHNINEQSDVSENIVDRDEYIADVKKKADEQFGSSFLNISTILARQQRKAFFTNLPIYGLAFAMFTLLVSTILTFVSIGFSHYSQWRAPRDISATLADSNALIEYVLADSDRGISISETDALRIRRLEDALIKIECNNATKGGEEDRKAVLHLASKEDCEKITLQR